VEETPHLTGDVLPAWGLQAGEERSVLPGPLPAPLTRDWVLAGATGRGVRVCILDSGVEGGHPLVGALESSVTVAGDEDAPLVVEDEAVDVSGHGTACAGIWATGRSPGPCNLFTKPGSSSPFAYS
jgi:subtilisin